MAYSDKLPQSAPESVPSFSRFNITGYSRPFQVLVQSLESSRFLLMISILGLLFRFAVLIATRHNLPFADETDYQDIAVSLIRKHEFLLKGWTSAFRPVGEPLLIAGVYSIVGSHLIVVKILQEIALTSLPFLCWRCAKRLGFSLLQANMISLLVALNPALAYATTTVYPTAATSILVTLGIVAAGSAFRFRSLVHTTIGAISLGLAGLFTTVFVPLPALIAVYFFFKRQLLPAIVLVLLGLLPSAAWMVRNKVALHTWTLATNGGMNLYLGANDEATPRSGNWVAEPAISGGELVRDRVMRDRGQEWIRTHRLRWAKLWLFRGALVVDSVGKPKTAGTHSGLAPRLIGWAMLPFTIAGILGLWLFRGKPEVVFLSLAVLLVVLSSATTIVKPRFRFPCDPLLTVLAIGAITKLVTQRSRKRSIDTSVRLRPLGNSH